MALFGVGCIACVIGNGWLKEWLREDSELAMWIAWATALGMIACLMATLALIVEWLARPTDPGRFALWSLCLRAVVITASASVLGLSMAHSYGAWQAVGAVIGALLALGAAQHQQPRRAVLGLLAVLLLGWTFYGTQTAYQFARRHSGEIVAAGQELADRVGRHSGCTPHPDSTGEMGHVINPGDPRVPRILRDLGAKHIWLDDEQVAIDVGNDTEFQIYHEPHPMFRSNTVWEAKHSKATSTKITDRLWMIDD